MTEEVPGQKRRHPRISLPKGMYVAWHGGDLQLFSRVRTLSMGGLFISVPNPPPAGTKLRLAFEVPGGIVHAEAIVRNIVRGEGMGVEFTRLELKDRILLEKCNRLDLTVEQPSVLGRRSRCRHLSARLADFSLR